MYQQEFKRAVRGLHAVKHFKAREIKHWLLYIGPVLLHGLVCDKLYQQIVNLSFAYRSSMESTRYVAHTAVLIDEYTAFISQAGVRNLTYNLHSLRHLPWQVENFGPLWTTSAMGFEAANHILTTAFTGNVNHCHLAVERYLRRKHMQCSVKADSIEMLTRRLTGDEKGALDETFMLVISDITKEYSMRGRVYCRTWAGHRFLNSVAYGRASHDSYIRAGSMLGQILCFFDDRITQRRMAVVRQYDIISYLPGPHVPDGAAYPVMKNNFLFSVIKKNHIFESALDDISAKYLFIQSHDGTCYFAQLCTHYDHN